MHNILTLFPTLFKFVLYSGQLYTNKYYTDNNSENILNLTIIGDF